MQGLVVVRAFGDYTKGSTITDPAEVASVSASHNQRNVVRTNLPDPPIAVVTAKPKPIPVQPAATLSVAVGPIALTPAISESKE
jgi:hypothetical protein